MAVGSYLVGISAPADGIYSAVDEVLREVEIRRLYVSISLDNKESVYGSTSLEDLTYTVTSGSLPADPGLVLETDAYVGSSVGEYLITIGESVDYDIEGSIVLTANYEIHFSNGTYNIAPLAITIKVNSGTAQYSGTEVTQETIQALGFTSVYTGTEDGASDVTNTLQVVLSKAEGTNVGVYPITATVSDLEGNYLFTIIEGTFTITSISGYDFVGHFTGLQLVYNASEQDLLGTNNLPEWIAGHYVVTDNLQTNAGTYPINVTITLTQADADNYNGGQTAVLLQVTGRILPKPITISADNRGHIYGCEPQTLTPQVVAGAGDESLHISFRVRDWFDDVNLSETTPVGSYNIYPLVKENENPDVNLDNYDFTIGIATYTVSKGAASLTVTANDVKYNKPLNYSITGTIGEISLTPGYYTVVFKDDNNNVVDHTSVLDATHTYTIEVTVDGTTNYTGASDSASFYIYKIELATPVVTYNKATATWDAVATDNEEVELYNSTVSYTINEQEVSGLSYTATSKDGLTLTATPSNTNYIAVQVELNEVFLVEYAEGTHTANASSASNMPDVEYLFAGQKVTEPEEDPVVAGYTFKQWELVVDQAYDFESTVSEDLTLTAAWTIVQYTITFKYVDESETLDTDMFNFLFDYNSTINSSIIDLSPVKSSDNPGIYYTFNNKWLNTVLYHLDNSGYIVDGDDHEYRVSGDATFVAQYDMNYNSFRISYYVKEVCAEEFSALPEYTDVVYLSAIELITLPSNIHWFNVTSWYLNNALTQAVPQTMPNHDINVYAEIRFNVGQGDVNGNGNVDANDISLYRQYIVGGYGIAAVEDGDEWSIANDFDDNALYFLKRVADNNNDSSRDIRDISITRMAIVGGYSWNIEAGASVSGQAIIRTISVATLNALVDVIESGNRAKLASDLTEELGVLNVSANQNIYIDLNGHTLTLRSVSLTETGYMTITIKNGTIVAEEGITLQAANGNLVIDEVTAYDQNGLINLQAASNSLHIHGVVEFRHGSVQESVPAQVHVEQGTHVVIEKESTIVVEKLVVTESFVPKNDVTAVISIDNRSLLIEDIAEFIEEKVLGYSTSEEVADGISTLEELIEAAAIGGIAQLSADINCGDTDITVTKSLKLDLNGHAITFTSWGFEVRNEATFTLEDSVGTGSVTAVEAALYAQRAGYLVVNGGTYTSTDNFVIGTHGSEGRGHNTITINGGTFNGSILSEGYVACGIYVANDDTVVVNGGTFNITNGVGILSRSGNTTINSEVTFNVTGDSTLGKIGDSRVVLPTGAVLVLDYKAAYPGGVPTLNNNTSYEVYVVVDGTYTFANDDDSFHAARGVYDNVILTGDFDDYLYVNQDMNIYLNGHTIDCSGISPCAIYVMGGAKVTINGNGNVIAREGCVLVKEGSELVINGGTFNITNGVGILSRSGNTTINNGVTFNVTGDNNTLGKVGDSKVTVPAGEVLVVDYAANYPGGTPALVNNSEYAVYALVDNEESLLAANQFADTIVFSKDIEITDELVVERTLTLNLNGHKLFNDSVDIWSDVNEALIGVSGGNLTIDGNGQVIAKSWDCYAIAVWGYGTLTINSGTFGGNCHAVYIYRGTATVNGGYFYVDQPTTNPVPYGYVLNCLDARYQAGEAHIIVNGGQFENFNPADCAAEAAHTNFLGTGEYTVTSEVISETKTVYTVTQIG